MSRAILTLNAGSSSLKFGVFELGAGGLRQSVHGQIENLGHAPRFTARAPDGTEIGAQQWPDGAAAVHEDVLGTLLAWIDSHLGSARLVAAGHRVVHGGRDLAGAVRVNAAVLAQLDALVPLAPLHQPHSLHAIRTLQAVRPGLPNVACFDTAFHRGQSDVIRHFALPRALTEAGIERYGFHGLSYEFIARALRGIDPALAQGRVVVAHLGSGASLCAMRDGRSVATTMSFTPLDGLMMGTRCGALDPGVVLHLMQARGMRAAEVEHMLYHESGLLGVSGLSADMRALTQSTDPQAAEAVAMFCHRAASQIAALVVALGGLDGIVFTAGIGEHSAVVRAHVADLLGWLGVALDPAANAAGAARIGTGRVAVLVIPADEEAMIAQHTQDVLGLADGGETA